MKLRDMLKGVDTREIIGEDSINVCGIAVHSGHVRDGFLFVCIRGARSDGHDYVCDSLERGAKVVVCETYPEISADTTVIVKDSRKAASSIAASFYGHPSRRLRTVGITGTNGKTTVAYLCKNMLEQAGEKAGLVGTIEYVIDGRRIPAERTTPDAVLLQSLLRDMVKNDCKAVVMEVSSHALHQRRVDSVEFDTAVFTNLTRDHLDYHGDMGEYLNAKARLFSSLLCGGGKPFPKHAVINADDPVSGKIISCAKGTVIRYGLDERYEISATDICLGVHRTSFSARTPSGEFRAETQLVGRHNVYNILAAVGVAFSHGFPVDAIAEGIRRTDYVPGRLQFIPNNLGVSVAVDYAHTDDALRNVITALREVTTGRVIVVFGCGGDRDPGKRPKMGRVVCDLADIAVVTSDNPRSEDPESIIDQVIGGFVATGCEYHRLVDRASAIRHALELAGPDDTVLLAGKGHETYQQFKDNIVVFDDREVARGILNELENRNRNTRVTGK